MKTIVILALLTLVGCSATNSLAPMPNITQPPVEASPHPSFGTPEMRRCGCRRVRDAIQYYSFVNTGTIIRIRAPRDDRWAAEAHVLNEMSNGMNVWVRGNAKVYLGGHGYNGWHKITFNPRGHAIFLQADGPPTSGYVKINIRFCHRR